LLGFWSHLGTAEDDDGGDWGAVSDFCTLLIFVREIRVDDEWDWTGIKKATLPQQGHRNVSSRPIRLPKSRAMVEFNTQFKFHAN
jgi:hypothetical protein